MRFCLCSQFLGPCYSKCGLWTHSMMERMVCKGEVGNLVRQRIAPERAGMGIDEPRKEVRTRGHGSQSCLTLCNPMDWSPPGFFVHEDSPGKSTGVVAMLSPRESSRGIEPRSPTLQADSLPAELPRKPRVRHT